MLFRSDLTSAASGVGGLFGGVSNSLGITPLLKSIFGSTKTAGIVAIVICLLLSIVLCILSCFPKGGSNTSFVQEPNNLDFSQE